MTITELARAKVNLYLHVTGRQANGYHTLESLVIFPAIADYVTVDPSPKLTLKTTGPFADELKAESTSSDNLIMQAGRLLRQETGQSHGAKITLEKNLPIAAGLGGGSADAAATLRALMLLWGVRPNVWMVSQLAKRLGADVPMCMASHTTFASGIGDKLAVAPTLPKLHVVLANPRVKLSTADVFKGVSASRSKDRNLPKLPSRFGNWDELSAFLKSTRNDLERPARQLAPAIGDCLTALRQAGGSFLVRMSGSGATCFGLYKTKADASKAFAKVQSKHPKWWLVQTEA